MTLPKRPRDDTPPLFPHVEPYLAHEMRLRAIEFGMIVRSVAEAISRAGFALNRPAVLPKQPERLKRLVEKYSKEIRSLHELALQVKVNRILRLRYMLRKTRMGQSAEDKSMAFVLSRLFRQRGLKDRPTEPEGDIYHQAALLMGPGYDRERVRQLARRSSGVLK